MKGIAKLILSLIFLLAACSVPVIDFPDTNEKLIVQCEFTEGDPLRIWVFQGAGIPVHENVASLPESLQLEVYQEGMLLETTIQNQNGIPFYTAQTEVMAGQEFNLRASVEEASIDEVEAETLVPFPDSIVALESVVLSSELIDEVRSVQIRLAFEISGLNKERYYEMSIFRVADGQLMPPLDTLWSGVTDDNRLILNDDAVLPAGISCLKSRNSFLIDHFYLNDKRIQLTLKMQSPEINDLSKVRFQLKSHTKDGYAFIRSYENTQAGYFAEFPILVSNVSNGLGVFTAYGLSEKELELNYH